MPEALTIRRLESADELDRLAPLWQALQAHHLSLGTIDAPGRTPEASWALRRALYERGLTAGGRIWIAERDGAAVGYAYARPDGSPATWDMGTMAMLDTLVVAPGQRGAGIGEALVDAVTSALRAEGVDHLQVGYIEGNVNAARFYERLGFRPLERILALPID